MLPEKAPTIKWQDKILDTGVLKIAGMQSVHTLLKLAQLRWRTGHITRMPDGRLPKKVIYVGLQVEKRSQGGQKKRYKDTLNVSLQDFNIPPGNKLHWIEQSGVASSQREPVTVKQRESGKQR